MGLLELLSRAESDERAKGAEGSCGNGHGREDKSDDRDRGAEEGGCGN